MRLVAPVHVEDHGGHAFERARGLERTDIYGAIGPASGEHDEIGVRDNVRVAAAGDAELRRGRLRSLGVPRADEDLILPGLVESFCECAPERAGASDDRNLHANATASRATSARRLRAAASLISVFVTTGRTPVLESASASAASFSSMTSASINPG